jgi:hypothetical protein
VKEVRLTCWEEFDAGVSAIPDNLQKKRSETGGYISSLLFRGHAQESWKLETTLERYTQKEDALKAYHRLMLTVKPYVESFTSKSWHVPKATRIDEDFPGPPTGYEFMVYLRHHGFPSPLLDWSHSPSAAEFFAFSPCQEDKEENTAIYAYLEYLGGSKSSSPAKGDVVGLGPSIKTHKRHHIQQSEYTICKKKSDNEYIYYKHEEVFKNDRENQDSLTKYLIPASERPKVLARLDLMNINAYSLFGDEDHLMGTLAYREIERKNR